MSDLEVYAKQECALCHAITMLRRVYEMFGQLNNVEHNVEHLITLEYMLAELRRLQRLGVEL